MKGLSTLNDWLKNNLQCNLLIKYIPYFEKSVWTKYDFFFYSFLLSAKIEQWAWCHLRQPAKAWCKTEYTAECYVSSSYIWSSLKHKTLIKSGLTELQKSYIFVDMRDNAKQIEGSDT